MAIANRSGCDVAVVGAGIFGLSVAWAALARGLSVSVIEARSVAAGASGGIVGALSPHVPDQWNPKKQFQLDALLTAATHWAQVEAVSGHDSGYARRGRLMPLTTPQAADLARDRADRAARHWGNRAQWQVLDAGQIAPQGWLATPAHGAVFETLSAQIHPARACAALAAAIRARGGEIIEQRRVTRVEPGAVITATGTLPAGAIVLAAGVEGFGLMPVPGAAQAGSGVKGQAAMLVPGRLPGAPPTLFADGTYVVAHSDGVAVGSTSERSFESPDTTDVQLDAVIERARRLCPPLRDAKVAARWAGVRPKARKRDPMLGPVPGAKGIFVANGAFKIGFGIAHTVGALTVDMIEGRAISLPDSFSVAHHLPSVPVPTSSG